MLEQVDLMELYATTSWWELYATTPLHSTDGS